MSYGQMAGAAGVSVDTVLSEPNCRPGGVVAGKVHLMGGGQAADIRHVTIALMPRMKNGYGGETAGPEVYRGALTRAFRLEPGQRRDLSFSIPLPYELPFTTVLGRELPGFTIGLCTEVDVKGAPDPGDIDPISVEPLKSQQWVLAAIARLGFRIETVAFEQSKLTGVPQQLPFYQEIQLAPPSQYAGRVGKVGLSFVASPRNMAFVLASGRDGVGRFQVEHPEAAETDWFSKIGQWLEEAATRPQDPSPGSFQSPPLPPPGGAPSTFPPPPGMPAPAAASYSGPGAYAQPGQGGPFPPPAPGPGHAPTPPPGHTPAPPPPQPGHLQPPPPHSAPYPPPAAPAQGMPYPPAPPGPGGPQYPPPPAPPGPPPPVHHHHGAPPYPGGHPGSYHRGPGWRAAGAVGGVAAAGVAGGLAAGAAVDAYGNVIGGAANVAGYAAGAGQFGDAVAGYAGGLAADAGRAVAGEVANEVAGEAAGAVGEILGGLLGGLFG